jgi:hypothetical protein
MKKSILFFWIVILCELLGRYLCFEEYTTSIFKAEAAAAQFGKVDLYIDTNVLDVSTELKSEGEFSSKLLTSTSRSAWFYNPLPRRSTFHQILVKVEM